MGNIMNHAMDSKNVPINGVDIRYVTLNMEPVSTDRTGVDHFSITNSQNNEVMEVKVTQSSVTIVLVPGTVTVNVTTIYDCPSLSDPVQYVVVVPGKFVTPDIIVALKIITNC